MKGRFLLSALALAVGYAAAAGFAWILLNVPESNVLALSASALCVVLIAVTTGLATGVAAALTREDAPGTVVRHAVSGLPGFFSGLALFAALWWMTGRADDWWSVHHGEIDAVFLRYFGGTRTAPLHTAAAWGTWLIRWALGLSVVVGLTVAGTERGPGGLGSGLRRAIRFVPITFATAGVLIVSEGLWRLVYWRPVGLPATNIELGFVVVKLGMLYLAAIGIAALVVRVFVSRGSRAARAT